MGAGRGVGLGEVAYLRRVVDDELDELLPGLPAIALEGPKAVGKTETASKRAATIFALDDPVVRELVRADPTRLVIGKPPVLVDEWQRMPSTWDVVRRAVDADPAGGRFLLTGSATPTEAPTHSGAGRIATVRMRPMSLTERRVEDPTVSLRRLLGGERPPIQGNTVVDLDRYVEEICISGFPGIRTLRERPLRTQLDGYIERIVEHEVGDLGRQVRNEGLLRRWMTAYAAATSTTASFETIRAAASAGTADKPAKTTTIPYRNALEQLWILDDVPAWSPTHNHVRRLGQAPRHHLADPALAARLLGADEEKLLDGSDSGPSLPRDGTLLGALFESLVTLCVRIHAQAAEARVGHLRTGGGEHEVDLIVERRDGRIVAIEVKLARVVTEHDLGHLYWLQRAIGPDLLDAVVVTAGPDAYRRADGIAVVPAALLGP